MKITGGRKARRTVPLNSYSAALHFKGSIVYIFLYVIILQYHPIFENQIMSGGVFTLLHYFIQILIWPRVTGGLLKINLLHVLNNCRRALYSVQYYTHRRRIKTEEKAKIVASLWGE